MMSEKQPEPDTAEQLNSLPDHASDWLRQFVNHLELYFNEVARELPVDADLAAYRLATLRAVLETLLDSGMELESFIESVGQIAMERKPADVAWTDEMNQRRFSLIDGEIQGTLTPAERVELATLTKIMREHIESELNLPMEGARALHRKLMNLDGTDAPN